MNTIHRGPTQQGDSSAANPNFALFLNFLLQVFPFAVSALLIYLGYDLYLRGVTGQGSLAPDATTLPDRLINAAPGLLLGAGGFVTLVVTIIKAGDSRRL
jgi:hypothetical protein